MRFTSLVLAAPLLVACRGTARLEDTSPTFSDALVAAGSNRGEIESALLAYGDDEPQKRAALAFLVENLPGKGFIDYTLRDEQGRAVPFDALAYRSLGDAEAAQRALEAQHGPLDFEKEALVEDVRTLRAADLVATVESAFAVWHARPWARDLSFETFCETLLPHRGSNEPFEDWRTRLAPPVDEALADLPRPRRRPRPVRAPEPWPRGWSASATSTTCTRSISRAPRCSPRSAGAARTSRT